MSASRQIRPLPGSGGIPAGNRKAPASASVITAGRAIAARIGKYEVETEVGGSPLIRVFHAWDRATARRVTLKVLTDVADPARVERFRREVAAMANVRSTSLISIYELGEHVGMPFAALEYVGDDHLAGAISEKRPFTVLEKLRVLWQIAGGVQAAHRGGLAFVGLCPSGIALCADGSAKVRDFGMVRLAGDASDETAPYQDGEFPDVLSDVFAFGVISYELLTGIHPVHQPITTLRSQAPECPAALEQLVARALEPDRELRYQSFDDIQYDAEPILREFERLRASELVDEARRCQQSQEVDGALAAIREAIELDPANAAAQRLHSELRQLAQRRAVRSRVESLVREAGEETGKGRFARAAELLESAARLDAGDPELSAHLQEIRARVEHSRRIGEALAAVRQALEREDLPAAEAQVLEVLEQEPDNSEALALADAVAEAIHARELAARVEEGIAHAKSLLLLESFDAAIDALAELHRQFPGSSAVAQWLAHAEQQKEQHDRRVRFDQQLADARDLMARQRFDEAAAIFERLRLEFPQEPALGDLLAECGAASERASTIAEAWARCEYLCGQERFDQALGVVDLALAAYPQNDDLAALRDEVERRRREFQSAAVVRQAFEEVQWLLDQDRVDLAAQFLREKVAAMPGQPALESRLAEVEQMQAQWERRRLVQDCLHRINPLEQAQQWDVALTVVEEALESCPESPELQEAVERLRTRLRDQERRKKLARWISEIRDALTDGDDQQAEERLERALAALPEEPALVELRRELERDKQFRQQWRSAQVLVGRRQFEKAEQILVTLDGSLHPEVETLLQTVREARAASEEQGFYKRGREKALLLIQQGQTEQAADLLRNLLSLFPGDRILQRDLQSLAGAQRESEPQVAPATPIAAVPPPPVEPSSQEHLAPVVVMPARVPKAAAWHSRRPVIAGAALFALVSAGAGVRRILHGTPAAAPVASKISITPPASPPTPAPPTSAPVAAASEPSPPPPAPIERRQSAPARPRESAVSEERESKESVARRPFSPPPSKPSTAPPAALASAPPPATPTVFYTEIAALPAVTVTPLRAPAPPPQPAPVTPPPQAAPVRATGGNLEPIRPISTPAPVMPQLAKERRISGVVTLSGTVDKRGAVTNIKIISGNPLLNVSARDAVAKWLYKPATLDGQPIEAEVRIEVRFDAGSR